MGIKVEWDGGNNEFYVKTGSGGRRTARKSSKEIIKFLESITDSDFTWSMAAKRQVKKGK